MSSITRPTIYTYESYRKFVEDFLNYFKRTKRAFSIRNFTKQSGFSSPSFYQSIIQGRRNISDESSLKVGQAFGLNKEEQKFFDLLIQFEQASNDEEANQTYEKLTKNRNFQKYHTLRKAQYEYFSKWYYPVIREMVALDNFKEDYDWIAQLFEPALDRINVQQCIDHLEKIGLLTRDENGKLRQSSAKLTTGSKVDSLLISRYHEKTLERAQQAIYDLKTEDRELRGIVLACPEEAMEKLVQKVEEFRKSILEDFGELLPGSNKIFQIGIQVTSATKKIE